MRYSNRFRLLTAAMAVCFAPALVAPATAQSLMLKGGPALYGPGPGSEASGQIGGQFWLAELFQFQGAVGYNEGTTVEGAVYFRPFRETLVLEPFVSAGYGRYFGGGWENAVSVVPLGVGVEYDLSPAIGLTFEVIGRYTLVESEDQFNTATGPGSDFREIDRGLVPTFGINYKLTQRARNFRGRLAGESDWTEEELADYADRSAAQEGGGEYVGGSIAGSEMGSTNGSIDNRSGLPGAQTAQGGGVPGVAGGNGVGQAGGEYVGEAGRASAAPGTGVLGESGRAANPAQGQVVGVAGRGYQASGSVAGSPDAAPRGAVMPGSGSVQDGDKVLVPDGTFIMGLFDEDPLRLQQAGLKRVTVSSFYIDKYEVSNREYRTWAGRQGTDMQPDSSAWNEAGSIVAWNSYYESAAFSDYPVVAVKWDQAQAYCEAQNGRLPTEAEWEYVARSGRSGGIYPWDGPEPRASNGGYLANYNPGRGGYAADGYAFTAPVAAFPSTPWGVYNLSGNAAEWTYDTYAPTYASLSDFNPRAEGDGDETRRVVRGGSWASDDFFIGVGVRDVQEEDEASVYTGFRCVREVGAAAPTQVQVPTPAQMPMEAPAQDAAPETVDVDDTDGN